MDVITHSARPPQSGVHRQWVAAPGGEAVKFTENSARAASSGVRARETPLGPTRAECGKNSAAEKTVPRHWHCHWHWH